MNKEICITIGDPSGISIEVLLKWFSSIDDNVIDNNSFFKGLVDHHLTLHVFGSIDILTLLLRKYDFPIKIKNNCLINKKEIKIFLHDVPYIHIERFKTGVVIDESGQNALDTLKSVCDFIEKDKTRSLVTLPVNKESIINVDSSFIGHTQYLAEYFSSDVMMCFFSPFFNLSLMTDHVPLKEVSLKMMDEFFLKKSIEKAYCFKSDNLSKKPLLVLGFNPHAGENGKIGIEDIHIKKVIDQMEFKDEIVGPISSDSAFVDVMKGHYDHVLACYHDQGLIPLKMLSKGKSVNYTYGLPFIRTSVDHGTAYDIVGSMKADTTSFHYALLKNFYLNCDV